MGQKILNSIEVQNPWRKMQVALLAEPKTLGRACLYNEMCWHFCTHHEQLHYWKQALSVTHAYKSLRTHAITSVVYGRNAESEPVRV